MKTKTQSVPEPVRRAELLLEMETVRHERRLRAINERFELMLNRLNEMSNANEEYHAVKQKILSESESSALKGQKSAPPPRPKTFQDVPKPSWASKGPKKKER